MKIPFPLEDVLIGAYTQLIGPYFWAFMLFLAVAAVYTRTRSFGPTYMVMAVGALLLETVLPGGVIHAIMGFTVVVGIVYSGYKFLVGRG